jgi:hypothetical protein
MIILPALKHVFDSTGVKPLVMVAGEFAGLLEGVSYVRPWIAPKLSWYREVSLARQIASYWFDEVIVPKWWDCPGLEPKEPSNWEATTFLHHLGRTIKIPAEEWDSYQFSQWRATGFTRQDMMNWPLVFDRRDSFWEEILANSFMHPKLPTVFYNFTGLSNRMPFIPEVMNELYRFKEKIHFVDMGNIRARRIQHLLGLMDRSLCTINGDTATLHLAAASPRPHIALLANGGAGSVPKGNCVLKLRYHQVLDNVRKIADKVEELYETEVNSKTVHRQDGPGGQRVLAVDGCD